MVRTNVSSTFIGHIGMGVIIADGFDAIWRLSGDISGGGVFSWSASSENVVTSVPGPGYLVQA